MRRSVITRAQRAAVYRLFGRYYDGFRQDLQPPRLLGSWRSLYRQYRRRFQVSGYGSDLYLFGQPFAQGEGQLWVGIETDGYTHS